MISRVRSSLKLRVLLGIALVVVMTAGSVGAVVAITARTWVYQDAQDQALTTFRQEMQAVPPDDGTTDPLWLYDRYPSDAIVTRDGALVHGAPESFTAIPVDIRRGVDQSPTQYRFSRISGGRIAIGYQPWPQHAGSAGTESVFVVRSLGSVSARISHLTTIVAIAVLVAAAVGLLAGLAVMRSVLFPLQRVTRTAAAVADGDQSVRMPETNISELHDLTVTFNDMLAKHEQSLTVLREQEQRAQRFVADVSHELRSPLAALVPAAEVLNEELAHDSGVQGRAARLVATEIAELSALVEDLLEMTRRDASEAEVRTKQVDVAAILGDALRLRGWGEIPIHTSGPVPLVTDPRRLSATVTNLVGNAVRHGASPISVDISTHNNEVTVTVSDHGAGIAAEHVPHIFERMYKASSARTRTGGAGLGLAIARENARLLGGDVTHVRVGNQTRFVATFTDLTDRS